MVIKYKNIKDFKEKELEDLFLSVEWDSGNYPDKLKKSHQELPRCILRRGL
nr:hypothetical protein [Methanobacterium formicicum]